MREWNELKTNSHNHNWINCNPTHCNEILTNSQHPHLEITWTAAAIVAGVIVIPNTIRSLDQNYHSTKPSADSMGGWVEIIIITKTTPTMHSDPFPISGSLLTSPLNGDNSIRLLLLRLLHPLIYCVATSISTFLNRSRYRASGRSPTTKTNVM